MPLDRLSRRLTDGFPDWPAGPLERPTVVIGVVHGEGVGPEVVGAACSVLDAVAAATGLRVDLRRVAGGEEPERWCGRLTEDVAAFCASVFADGGAVLSGPVGGRFVYEVRAHFDLFCKLVPLRPCLAISDAMIVRPERLREVDVLIVRENISGAYFGEFGRREEGRVAYQHFCYRAEQVRRIGSVAASLARARRGKLTAIVKDGGVPAVSALWREEVGSAAEEAGVRFDVLDVDNASFQLVAQPLRFDVVVAPNMFGDVLADGATVLLGSRGMSYSCNLGPGARAVYQTGHGAARDLAGADTANPVAQISTLAMMLRESFGLDDIAMRIEAAIEQVLAAGFRTADIAGPGAQVVGTRKLADLIAERAAGLTAVRTERT